MAMNLHALESPSRFEARAEAAEALVVVLSRGVGTRSSP